jgi:hypothetical protein
MLISEKEGFQRPWNQSGNSFRWPSDSGPLRSPVWSDSESCHFSIGLSTILNDYRDGSGQCLATDLLAWGFSRICSCQNQKSPRLYSAIDFEFSERDRKIFTSEGTRWWSPGNNHHSGDHPLTHRTQNTLRNSKWTSILLMSSWNISQFS